MEGTVYEEVSTASYSENDISNSLKNGILYLEDPIDHVSSDTVVMEIKCEAYALLMCFSCLCALQTWTPHYFVLTTNKIYYSEETSHYQTADDDEEEEDESKDVIRVMP